jgi:hypothetical protein
VGGCRKLQEDAPRRMRPDASFFDAGPIEASSCSQVTCDPPAECRVNNGVAACVCRAGYTDDPSQPGTCVDVDECADGSDDCDSNANCNNTPGGFECVCKDGFGGNGKLCHSLNDCEGLANTCHTDATCMRGDDGVMCSCTTGFEGDGHLCMDIDECEQGTAMCPANSTCQNRRAAYDCTCDPGFEGDRNNCQDSCAVAQTDPARCDARGHGRCQLMSDGSAKCTSCQSDSVGDGVTCTMNTDCANLGCGDNTVCAGESGSRHCECAPGYSGDPASGCSDIDECMNNTADCDANTTDCVNTQGGFMCVCKQGLQRDGQDCVDIDECARGLDLCDSSAICKNQPIGYTCECKPGYEGNGYACADIDECERGEARCAKDGLTMCQNTRGGYQCLCPKGYAGDGKTEACYCDLSGWWGVREKATVTVPQRAAGNVVIIDRSTTHATIWELHHYVYDGSVIKEERQQCGANTGPEIYSPLYTETYTSSIPFMVYDSLKPKPQVDIPLPRAMALPGKPFVTPRDAVTQGIKLDDPLNDPWPAKHTDVAASMWEDSDNDGEPGITLWPGQTTQMTLAGNGTYSYLPVELMGDSTLIATRTGCVSTALRAIGHFEGNIVSCSRITGRVINDKTEGRVEGCAVLRQNDWDTLDVTCKRSDWNDARHCNDEQIEFLDDQDQTSETQADFESVKLGEADATDIDCAAVRKALPAE